MSDLGEFYFPIKREQLLEISTDNRFILSEDLVADEETEMSLTGRLDELEMAFQSEVTSIYSQDTFSHVFRLMSSFAKCSSKLKMKILEILSKYFSKFASHFEKFFDNGLDFQQNNSKKWRNVFKIFVFSIEWLTENILIFYKNRAKEIKKGRRRQKGAVQPTKKAKEKNTKQKNKLLEDNNQLSSDGEEAADPKEINGRINDKLKHILSSLENICIQPLKELFKNKIIEDECISLMIKINFDALEIGTETKDTRNKALIFKVLQSIISHFQTNTNIELVMVRLTTKIVNLIYAQEDLVTPLSEFIVQCLSGESNLNRMAIDIIQEVSKTVFEDNSMEGQGIRNVAKFLIFLSERSSKIIYNNITTLLQFFDCPSYVIRNAIVEMMGHVIVNFLCKLDDINDIEVRNNYTKAKINFIDLLLKRIYDKSPFCRAKVLQTFERLCEKNTIDIGTYLKLLKEATGRLRDEKSIVRKRAISLVGRIIGMYIIIYKCDHFYNRNEIKVMIDVYRQKIAEKEEKIKELDNDDKINPDKIEQNKAEKDALNEEISKNDELIDYFNSFYEVLDNIDMVVPCVTQLLSSRTVSDVIESIDLFLTLHHYRVESSEKGIRKMLVLIMKNENSIKKKVIDAFSDIYFNNDKQTKEIQAAGIIHFCSQLNYSEYTCVDELLKNLIEHKQIHKDVFKEIWKILIKNPKNEMKNIKAKDLADLNNKLKQIELESITAMRIINMASNYKPEIIRINSDSYIRKLMSILNVDKNEEINWSSVKYGLEGLVKIYQTNKDPTKNCLISIAKALVRTYGNAHNDWFIACKEFIDTIFKLFPEPEQMSQYLIIKLSMPFFISNEEEQNKETKDKFKTQNIFPQAPSDLSSSINGDLTPNKAKDKDSINQMTPLKLAQLIFVVGHIALNMIIYGENLEATIKKKFSQKERNKNKSSKKKKKKNEDDEEAGENDEINNIVGGQEAEVDLNISLIHKIIDEDLLVKNLISKYVPMISSIAKATLKCKAEDLEKNMLLYKSAIMSYCKLMLINSDFCKNNINFIFDLLNNDTIPSDLKLNVCLSFGDLVNRFPNIMISEVNKFFEGLHSPHTDVVKYTLTVISHLVLNDMLKMKGEVVDICMLLDHKDPSIRTHVQTFFNEINNKGNNVIYNIIPKALARLSNEFKSLEYSKFKTIAITLLKYVDKEKHIEGLMDKLFVKLRNSTDNLEWRNNTFVLSELNYNSEKILIKFLQSYNDIRDKNDDLPEVKENLAKIFSKLERIQNLSEAVLNNLKECKEKIFKGEKYKVYNSKYKSNSVGSSQRSSRNGSKRSSRSGSQERNGPAKRTHKQIDLAKIDEEINEGIEDNEKQNNMNVLANKKKGGNKKSSDKKKNTKNKPKKKKRNKSKNSSSSSSDEDYDGNE
jgi:condensin complex subunit 1